MKKEVKFTIIAVLVILIIPIAYYLISPFFIKIEMNEESPMDISDNETLDARVLLQGEFMPSAHEVEGEAKVIEKDGKRILRFENFETINGPNLHIYLASDLNVNDYVDLGEIKATKGNVNYEIPEGVNLEEYNYVVIWCVPFKVLFSYSELS